MEFIKEKNKRTGVIVSIVFHALLLVLFAFFGLKYLDPPPAEEGISINFGSMDMGKMSPSNAPPVENIEPTPEPEPEVSKPVPAENVEEEVVTQDSEEAPAIEKKEEEKKIESKEPIKEEKKPDQKVMSALDKWKKNQQETSGGDGNTDKEGDQGALDGDKNSTNYNGGGAGNGTTFSLSGRDMVSSPKIDDKSQEVGKVVVDIIVDRKGNVVRAVPGARGSSTASAFLYEKAKKAALQTRFSANPDAAIEQKGQMTFIFILN